MKDKIMNSIKIIVSILLSAGSSLLAQPTQEIQSTSDAPKTVCERSCTSREPEVKILNRRNRFTERGAMQRRMYPRFMHSRIPAERVVCDCPVCHTTATPESKTTK